MTADRVKIMVVAEPDELAARVEPPLAASGFEVIRQSPAHGLHAAIQQHRPDLVVIGAQALASTLAELEAKRTELAQSRAELEDRKLIERAKGLLMQQRNLTEPDAYRTLQKLAMDRKRRLADVARNVLEMAELFTEKPKEMNDQ